MWLNHALPLILVVLVEKRIPATGTNGGLPSDAEKVRASHILIKVDKPQPVPEFNEVIKYLEKKDEHAFMQEFVRNLMKQAKIEAAEEFKRFVPPDDQEGKELQTREGG